MYRIGSIGAGRRGRIVKMAHRPDDGFELAVVSDLRDDVLAEYQQEFGDGIEVTKDWRRVIERDDVDAVFVTTPDFLHAEQTVAALEAGKAVYVEKPLAITVEQCDAIVDAASRNGNRLYVGHNMRFFPVMKTMKALIDAGTIGEVQAIWCRHFIDYGGDAYFKDWHSERQYTTGLLLQKGAHDLDLIHWFGGGYTQRTVAMGKLGVYNRVADRRSAGVPGSVKWNESNWPPLAQKGLSPVIDVEDHNMVLLQLDNGVQATYTQCHYTPDSQRNYTIIGTEGRIENHGDHSTAAFEAEVLVWKQRCGHRLMEHQRIPVPRVAGTHGGADPQIVDDFLQFLKTGRSHGATFLDARMSAAAGVMATRSLREGNQPFDVPPPRTTPAAAERRDGATAQQSAG